MPDPTLDERLVDATVATLEMFGVYLGRRLGLYRALRDLGDATPAELAGRAGIAERYAREWLEQQSVAGFLAVEGDSPDGQSRRYRLPDEHVGALVEPEDAAHVAPFADMVVGVAQVLDDVVEAYRTGGGVPYLHYGSTFRAGQGAINRPAFMSDLTGSWLPAAGDLHERLSRPGARIADVGCGHGWSTIALTRAYPDADVTGYDLDVPSIAEARENASAAGVDVRFVEADAGTLGQEGPFDAVLVMEALHDMAQPVEALVAFRSALAPGGSVVVADENVAEEFTAPGDTIERMMFGWSIAHCLPAALAEKPSEGIGTVLRPARVRELAAQAGFGAAEVVDVDAGFFRIYRLRERQE